MTFQPAKDQYEDSADFTQDLDRLKRLSQELLHLIGQPAFGEWMKSTDQHFNNVDTFHLLRRVRRDAKDLDASIDALTDELHRAS